MEQKIKIFLLVLTPFILHSCRLDVEQKKPYPNLEVGDYWITTFNQKDLQNASVIGTNLFCNTINFSAQDYLYCLSLKTGQVVWKTSVNRYATQPVEVYNDELFFSTYTGEISKISMDGSKIWEINFPSSYAGHKINPINGNLMVNSVVNGCYEFDNATGDLVHHYDFKSSTNINSLTMPLFFNNQVIFGNVEIDSTARTASFVALDYNTKEISWQSDLNKSVRRLNDEKPLVSGDYVISIEEGNNVMHCIDATSGKVVWSHELHQDGTKNSSLQFRLTATQAMYYNGMVVGLNLKTGAEEKVTNSGSSKKFYVNSNEKKYEIVLHDQLEKPGLEVLINEL